MGMIPWSEATPEQKAELEEKGYAWYFDSVLRDAHGPFGRVDPVLITTQDGAVNHERLRFDFPPGVICLISARDENGWRLAFLVQEKPVVAPVLEGGSTLQFIHPIMGLIEEGETPEGAALREAWEEVGLKAGDVLTVHDLGPFNLHPNGFVNWDRVIDVRVHPSTMLVPKANEELITEVIWLTPQEWKIRIGLGAYGDVHYRSSIFISPVAIWEGKHSKGYN